MEQKNIMQNRNIIKRTDKTKSWFFENMNKIDRPLIRLVKKMKKKCINNRHEE